MRETLSGSDRLIVPEGRDTLRDAVPSADGVRVSTFVREGVNACVSVGGTDRVSVTNDVWVRVIDGEPRVTATVLVVLCCGVTVCVASDDTVPVMEADVEGDDVRDIVPRDLEADRVRDIAIDMVIVLSGEDDLVFIIDRD